MNQLGFGVRPTTAPEFPRKLGMGKPLGLRSVKIEVARVEAVERAKRSPITLRAALPAKGRNGRGLYQRGRRFRFRFNSRLFNGKFGK